MAHAGRGALPVRGPALPARGLPGAAQAGAGGRPPDSDGRLGRARTPRLAARFAHEYNLPFSPLEAVADQFSRVRAACEREGRDPADMVFSVALTTCCGRDEQEAARRAERVGWKLDQLRTSGLGGTPDEIVERLHAYRDAGADVAYLQLLDVDDLDHLRLLAAEVLPAAA